MDRGAWRTTVHRLAELDMTEQLTFSLYSYYVHSLAWKLVAGPLEFSREEDISPYYRTSHQCSICFRLFLFLKMYSFLSPS